MQRRDFVEFVLSGGSTMGAHATSSGAFDVTEKSVSELQADMAACLADRFHQR